MEVTVSRVPRPNLVEKRDVSETETVQGLLDRMGIPLDAVVVIRDEVPIPLDAPLRPQDRLRIVNVFSGG